jgi:hypothetical protein
VTRSSFKNGIAGLGLVAILAFWVATDYRSRDKLNDDNTLLRQQISQLSQPSSMPERWSPERDDELDRLRHEHSELLRLRGELGLLRDTMDMKKGELAVAESEVAHMLALSNVLQKAAWATSSSDLNTIKYVGVACRVYAANNAGLLPTSFGQIQNELAQYVEFPPGADTNTFEFFDYGQALSTNTPPYYFLARETQPVQYPDGHWRLVYLLVDGSAQIGDSSDGNFDSWEQQWIQRQAQESGQPISP